MKCSFVYCWVCVCVWTITAKCFVVGCGFWLFVVRRTHNLHLNKSCHSIYMRNIFQRRWIDSTAQTFSFILYLVIHKYYYFRRMPHDAFDNDNISRRWITHFIQIPYSSVWSSELQSVYMKSWSLNISTIPTKLMHGFIAVQIFPFTCATSSTLPNERTIVRKWNTYVLFAMKIPWIAESDIFPRFSFVLDRNGKSQWQES